MNPIIVKIMMRDSSQNFTMCSSEDLKPPNQLRDSNQKNKKLVKKKSKMKIEVVMIGDMIEGIEMRIGMLGKNLPHGHLFTHSYCFYSLLWFFYIL